MLSFYYSPVMQLNPATLNDFLLTHRIQVNTCNIFYFNQLKSKQQNEKT